MHRSDDVNPTGSRVKLTYDDFLLFPDDGQRHELIGGEHYVTPSPASVHQRIVGNIYFRLRLFLETHPVGEVFLAPFDVVFGEVDDAHASAAEQVEHAIVGDGLADHAAVILPLPWLSGAIRDAFTG